MTQSSQHPATQSQGSGRRSPAEWTTLIITHLIVGTLIGMLIWHAFTHSDDIITFTVTVDHAAIEQHGDTFQVPFEVRNTGHATAEDVLVHVAVLRGEESVEETELTFRFMGEGETAHGVALFSEDPRANTLEAQVTSFLIP